MTIELLRSTGDQRVDDILRGALGLLDAMLPGRMRGAYLTGSLVDGTATDGSDVDVLVVIKGTMSEDDAAAFRLIRLDGSRLAGRFLDFAPESEMALFAEGTTPAKAATFDLIWGEETRDRWAIESDAASLHHPMRGSYFYLGHFRGSMGPLVYPLSYPDPNGEFFGYERRGYHDLEGWISPGTKTFVGGMTLAASVIVAIRAGKLPVTLQQSLVVYREHVGDAWTPFLEEVVEACRDRWTYRVPESPTDRERLQGFCARALDFENHYLQVCREHLLNGLSGADEEEQARSLDTLFRLRYPDREIADAIESLTSSANDDVRRLAAGLHAGERYSTTRWR